MDTAPMQSSFKPLELAQTVYTKEKSLFAILAVLSGIFWTAVILGTVGIALIYLLFFFLIYLFTQSAFISYLRGNAVEITEDQFPELHRRLLDCCQKLDMKEVPKAYLMASDGVLNALATRFLWRNYVVLFSSIVEALDDQPDGLNFYIGHELGHLRRNHLGKAPFIAPFAWLPILGPAYSRACEYSCDLHGLRCCDSLEAATNAVAVLSAGAKKWKQLNLSRYLQQVQDSSGFWMSYHELANDYPWLSKRMAHIHARGQGLQFKAPGRNPIAYLFAFLTPRMFGGGGASVLIVFAVIGILAAVAIPAYQQYTMRAHMLGGADPYGSDPYNSDAYSTDPYNNANGDTQDAEQEPQNPGDSALSQMEIAAQVSSLQPVMAAVVSHYQAQQAWPESLDQLQLDASLLEDYPSLTLYSEGILGFTGSESLGDYQSQEIYLQPEESEETQEISWTCFSPEIPDDYLPEHCQG